MTAPKVVAAPTKPEPTASPEADASADPLLAPHRFKLSNGAAVFYYRNLALNEVHPRVRRAVIAVPNVPADQAGEFFRGVLDLAKRAGHDRDTLVIAPVFAMSASKARPDELRWEHGWETGGQSSGEASISSFCVMDEIFASVTSHDHFPDLRKVVVAGNSLAGTFVNRYIAGGRPRVAERPKAKPVEVEYLVMAATSYLYLDRLRPVEGTTDFAEPDTSACPDFNQYRYGLEKRNPAMARLSTQTLRANMMGRKAVYLVGGSDHGTDKHEPSRALRLQGRDRHERATNYANYIRRFPDWAAHVEFHPVPGAGHLSLMSSDCPDVRDHLFGRCERGRNEAESRS
jgi:hypothetical protein